MNEENNVNQETEEKKELAMETASVAEEKKTESTEEKAKKMDEVFETSGEMVIKDVAKIAGRELTDEEKKEVLSSLKAFLFTFIIDDGRSFVRW